MPLYVHHEIVTREEGRKGASVESCGEIFQFSFVGQGLDYKQSYARGKAIQLFLSLRSSLTTKNML